MDNDNWAPHDASWKKDVRLDTFDRAIGQALLANTVVSKLYVVVDAVVAHGIVADAELLMTFIRTSLSLQIFCVVCNFEDVYSDFDRAFDFYRRPPLFDVFVAQLVQAAGQNASITQMYVDVFCAPVLTLVARLIETSLSICNLELGCMRLELGRMNDTELEEVQQIWRALQSNTTLTTLNLSCLQWDVIHPIFESLYALIGLECLIITICQGSWYYDDLEALCVAGLCCFFKTTQTLHHFSWGNVPLASDVWEAINANESLRRLDFSRRIPEANTGSSGLVRMLNNTRAFHHLRLWRVNCDSESFHTWNAVGTNQTLNRLDVERCEFDDTSTKHFLDAISKRRDVKLTIDICQFKPMTAGDVVADHVMHSAFNTVDFFSGGERDEAALLRKLSSKENTKIWERSTKFPSLLHLCHFEICSEDWYDHMATRSFYLHLPAVLHLKHLTLRSSLLAVPYVPVLRKNGSLHKVFVNGTDDDGTDDTPSHQQAIRLIDAIGQRNQNVPELIREAASLDEPPLLVPYLLEAMQPVARMAPNTALTMALLLGDKIDPPDNAVKRSTAHLLFKVCSNARGHSFDCSWLVVVCV